MTLLTRFRAAPAGRRRLYLEALLLMGAIRVAVFLLPLRHVRRLLSAVVRIGRRTPPHEHAVGLEDVESAVAAAASVVPRATCLVRALAVQALLQMRESEARLCIGVRRGAGGAFEAHAWVETDDRTSAAPENGYRTLATFDRVWP